jgi:amino acid transporter
MLSIVDSCRYTMIAICPILYVGWKFLKKTEIPRLEDIDLQKNLDEIAEYERSYVPNPPK